MLSGIQPSNINLGNLSPDLLNQIRSYLDKGLGPLSHRVYSSIKNDEITSCFKNHRLAEDLKKIFIHSIKFKDHKVFDTFLSDWEFHLSKNGFSSPYYDKENFLFEKVKTIRIAQAKSLQTTPQPPLGSALPAPVAKAPLADASPATSSAPVMIHPLRYSEECIDSFVSLEDRKNLTGQVCADRKEFLRRIDKEELHKALAVTKVLPPLKSEELEALTLTKWEHPIFRNSLLEFYALQAFISGKLDKWVFSEIFLYKESNRVGTQGHYALFNPDGSRDDISISVLKLSLDGFFTDGQVEKFLAAIAAMPPLRTQFYRVPIQGNQKTETIVEVFLGFEHTLLTTRFLASTRNGSQIVLSPHLLNELYKAKFGEQVCLANPVLGKSISASNFKKPEQKDVLIPCGLFPSSTPTHADGVLAPPLEFYHHDGAYHLYIESTNPHRKARIELANLFEGAKSDSFVYKALLDRELKNYEPKTIRLLFTTNSQKFWVSLTNCLGIPPIKRMVKYMYEHKERWESEYGIKLADPNTIPRNLPGEPERAQAQAYLGELQAQNTHR